MKQFIIMVLSFVSIFASAVPCFMAAAASKHEYTFDVAGFDTDTTAGSICVYPNESSAKRVIGSVEYGGFRDAKLLVFDKEGRLIEAGGNLYANSSGVTGSPQLSVTVPAGGFLVAFRDGAPSGLRNCYDAAMEGAMLYNATMSVIYEVYGSYDKNAKKLTIRYDDPAEPSENAKKFLFVGNSATYFNGTPIKFKGLCQAAGIEVDVDYCTFGSAYLSEFADENHERGKALRHKLRSKKYDYIVLQDAGSATYYTTNAALNAILPLIEENGATPLLYMRYSADSNPSNRYNGAVTHYRSYTRISQERGIVCAPVAVAFLYCTDEYPNINLYADDNSHHSKEGSYLAACTFLYQFFGVSPIGNSYQAQLDDDVAEALQKCAVKACDEKFEYADEDLAYTENGVRYGNLARGKSYVPSGSVYQNKNWTDTDENGSPMGKLTDGYIATGGTDTAIGCYQGSETSVTIDLGGVFPIKRMFTDLYGNASWGIPDPGQATVSVSVSTDGKSFNSIGLAQMSEEKAGGDWKRRDFTLTLSETVPARYVRVTYQLKGNFCWSSEIAVFGVDTALEESESEEESAASAASEEKPEEKSSPTWLYVLIGAAAAAAAGVLAAILNRKKKNK